MRGLGDLIQKKFDRRNFIKLAGIAAAAGAVASLTARGAAKPASSAVPAAAARTNLAGGGKRVQYGAQHAVQYSAQYGRGRGRYPVATR